MKLGRIATSLVSLGVIAGLSAAPSMAAPVPNPHSNGTTDVQSKNVMRAMFSDDVRMDPRGVNDWSCKLTPEHPNPVILIHGAFMSTYTAWSNFGPRLAKEGFCVYGINYGREEYSVFANMFDLNGSGSINESVEDVYQFVKAVVAYTGAKKVDLVGYSEGGLQGQLLLKRHGAALVDKFITIGGVQKGTTLSGVTKLFPILENAGVDVDPVLRKAAGQAANEMVVGSQLVKEANAGGDTLPTVTYTAISSQHDMVVTPIENSQFTAGPNVTNIVLQDGCSKDYSDHLAQVYNDRAYAYLVNALYGKQVMTVPCDVVIPFGNTVK